MFNGVNGQPRQPVSILEAIEQLFPLLDAEADNDAALFDEPAAVAWPNTPSKCWPLPEGFPRPHDDTASVPGLAGPYASPPRSPFDLFAVASYLLELSGCYHHIMPGASSGSGNQANRSKRVIVVSEATIKACRRQAKTWRKRLAVDDPDAVADRAKNLHLVMDRWDELVGRYGSYPVYQEAGEYDEAPTWWRLALELLIIADDTAEDVGLIPLDLDDPEKLSWPWFTSHLEIHAYEAGAERPPLPISFSEASTDVACVQPKARTTPVGCTLRSLSHHLALLPPRGIARARWMPLLQRGTPIASDDNQFNILLVPFPYSVTDREFTSNPAYDTHDNDWRFFSMKHTWLQGYGDPALGVRSFTDLLIDFIMELVRQAENAEGATRIDAIVFPELALDYSLFQEIGSKLPERLPSLRLLISGLSTSDPTYLQEDAERLNPISRNGNFVGVASFYNGQMEMGMVREKHHRWMLDRSQIVTYGLKRTLDPRCKWWEDIDHLNRRVDFTVFKSRSVLAAMICEDLARVDPCHELLRSIGPNLVVALLFDAPQLRTRWPARYATILAEDPGSSVLTLTSRGLMTRQMLIDTWPANAPRKCIISLWRDDYTGEAIEIECPPEAHAVWLKLHSRRAHDKTLDGRLDRSAVSWIHACDRPLFVPNVDEVYGPIVGTPDKELRIRRAKERTQQKVLNGGCRDPQEACDKAARRGL